MKCTPEYLRNQLKLLDNEEIYNDAVALLNSSDELIKAIQYIEPFVKFKTKCDMLGIDNKFAVKINKDIDIASNHNPFIVQLCYIDSDLILNPSMKDINLDTLRYVNGKLDLSRVDNFFMSIDTLILLYASNKTTIIINDNLKALVVAKLVNVITKNEGLDTTLLSATTSDLLLREKLKFGDTVDKICIRLMAELAESFGIHDYVIITPIQNAWDKLIKHNEYIFKLVNVYNGIRECTTSKSVVIWKANNRFNTFMRNISIEPSAISKQYPYIMKYHNIADSNKLGENNLELRINKTTGIAELWITQISDNIKITEENKCIKIDVQQGLNCWIDRVLMEMRHRHSIDIAHETIDISEVPDYDIEINRGYPYYLYEKFIIANDLMEDKIKNNNYEPYKYYHDVIVDSATMSLDDLKDKINEDIDRYNKSKADDKDKLFANIPLMIEIFYDRQDKLIKNRRYIEHVRLSLRKHKKLSMI